MSQALGTAPAEAAAGTPVDGAAELARASHAERIAAAEDAASVHRPTALALAVGLAAFIATGLLPERAWMFVAFAVAHVGVLQWFLREVRRDGPQVRRAARVVIVFPVLAITGGIHLMGEVGMACGALLYSLIIAPGQERRFSGLSPLAIASVEIVAFAALQAAEASGLLPPPYFWRSEPYSLDLRLVMASATTLLLACTAVFATRSDRLLAARTRALRAANRALAEQNAGLARIQEEFESYARGVAHDLANPLAAAVEGLGALRGEMPAASSEARELAELTQRSLARALEMLAGLRDITKTVASDERLARVSMGDVAMAAVAEFELTIRSRGIRLVTPAAWPTVVVQRAKMLQVWRNLIANAIRHGATAPSPTIRLLCERTAGGWVFGVADDGPGIPPGYERRVFDPFERAGGSDGMGLGLTLVKRVVEHQGGTVEVRSTPGAGSTFRFTVPEPRIAAVA